MHPLIIEALCIPALLFITKSKREMVSSGLDSILLVTNSEKNTVWAVIKPLYTAYW